MLGTRPDGYHDLKTVFQSLSLFDNVTVTARRGPLAVTCDEPDIPTDQRNLVWKAASLLHRVATGKASAPRDVTIDLRKRVPSEAGLGGGSANAAMTLLALNKLWKLDLDLATLTRIGARLGADVPYFLVGGTALGLGRGDDIYPLADMPPVHVVILRPGFGVATSDAYQWFDEELRRRERAGAARRSRRMAGLVRHAEERSRDSRDSPPSRDWTHPPIAARCRGGVCGHVGVGIGGIRPVRARRRGAQNRERSGEARLAVAPHPHSEPPRLRSPGCRRPLNSATISVCPGVLGRGQAVRRRPLEPVFEGSNPSAPTSFID